MKECDCYPFKDILILLADILNGTEVTTASPREIKLCQQLEHNGILELVDEENPRYQKCSLSILSPPLEIEVPDHWVGPFD